MDKLKSRKLGATIVGILVAALNRKLSLGLTENEILAMCGLIASYVASQGYVDAKGDK
jgi:hypothetical protein